VANRNTQRLRKQHFAGYGAKRGAPVNTANPPGKQKRYKVRSITLADGSSVSPTSYHAGGEA
jgi:hypothetical protein